MRRPEQFETPMFLREITTPYQEHGLWGIKDHYWLITCDSDPKLVKFKPSGTYQCTRHHRIAVSMQAGVPFPTMIVQLAWAWMRIDRQDLA